MRLALFGIALVLLDCALFWGTRNLAEEKGAIAERIAGINERLRSSEARDQEERRVRRLVERASSSMKQQAPDIASLRDLLVGAERGLDIDRLSLDFRSDETAGASRAGLVAVTLGGSFAAVHRYLERVEALRLALSPEEISLRREEQGRVQLQARWRVTWSGGASLDFSPEEVGRLEAWLARELEPPPGRDPFSPAAGEPEVEERVAERPLPFEEPLEVEEPSLAGPTDEVPRLLGFVLARPELESDVNRRVLAAMRFEGELFLVAVGDELGRYKVAGIEPRESITLVFLETGEPMTLALP